MKLCMVLRRIYETFHCSASLTPYQLEAPSSNSTYSEIYKSPFGAYIPLQPADALHILWLQEGTRCSNRLDGTMEKKTNWPVATVNNRGISLPSRSDTKQRVVLMCVLLLHNTAVSLPLNRQQPFEWRIPGSLLYTLLPCKCRTQ